MNDPNDDLARARTGDRDAMRRLIDRNQKRLRSLLELRLTPDLRARTHLSDILQSTFLQVLRSVDRFRGDDEEQFSAWLVRILENRVRDKRRYFQAEKRRGSGGIEEDQVDPESLRGGAHAPNAPLDFAEEFRAVHLALDALKAEHRQILVLRLVENQSHEAIAARLGKSEDACRQAFARARAAFLTEVERHRDDLGRQ